MLLVNLNQDKSKVNKYLSNTLLEAIENSIKNNKKVILYLNKRWEYNSLICKKCNKLYKCDNCDISMSIHWENMICHMCNNHKKIESKCDNCNSFELEKVWIWTIQIENSLKNIYKNINIFRLDTDVIKNKKEKEMALSMLDNAQIIIWTKMITTWFDFRWVGLIWVILIEQELQIAKYNTEEKVFSNIKQLIWRWWRLWEETDFIVQSYITENEIVKDIVFWNYKDFFIKTLKERKSFWYPPFKELITLEYRNKDKEKSEKYIDNLYIKLTENIKNKNIEIILSKTNFKKHNQYFNKIILKWENIKNNIDFLRSEIFKNPNLTISFN